MKEKRKKSWPWHEEKEKSGHGVLILNSGERRVASCEEKEKWGTEVNGELQSMKVWPWSSDFEVERERKSFEKKIN